MPPLLEIQGVSKRFLHEGREITVVRDVDLSIEAGERLAIVGPSGAGKSTLLHILGTLDLPTSGKILWEGHDVTRYSSSRLADFRNRSIGFVFQFHHLLPEFTAVENVMMPGLVRGLPRGGALEKRATELLKEVGLGHRLSHRPGELSGGEQQRVALARALVMEPKLILADEPTGNLDSKTSEQMHQLFVDLNEKRGTTFLVVTHSRDLAAQMPRVVRMRDGAIEADERREPGRERSDAAPESEATAGEIASHDPEHDAPERGTSGDDAAETALDHPVAQR